MGPTGYCWGHAGDDDLVTEQLDRTEDSWFACSAFLAMATLGYLLLVIGLGVLSTRVSVYSTVQTVDLIRQVPKPQVNNVPRQGPKPVYKCKE